MLNTAQLEKAVKSYIKPRLPEADFQKIHFAEGSGKSPEGTYVFSKAGQYHFLFTEKGEIKFDKISNDFSTILWNSLDAIIFDLALEYAKEHQLPGKDFRRALFAKEIELYAKFGKEFEVQKRNEVRKILKETPYHNEK